MTLYCDICGQKIENLNNVENIIDNVTECSECLCPIKKTLVSPIPDGSWVKAISTDESFMNAMVKLYETDPIEYQLKIQQFKTQLQQQEHAGETKQQQIISNQPHCPTCGSTNLAKVSTFSKIMDSAVWGFGGKQRYKTYHCNNCGYEW